MKSGFVFPIRYAATFAATRISSLKLWVALVPVCHALVEWAARSTVASSNGRPTICAESGSACAEKPVGKAAAGCPVRLNRLVMPGRRIQVSASDSS